ncbi:polysaccharide biosynthesis C-terminal domain-containing protein [candidate division WOR-3 bacterium]|nr:polysaccharide biosynthesis C-terminal domain-containing protein [candidate division WOR-3 bacterium]
MNLKTLLRHIFIYSAGAVFYQIVNILSVKTYTNIFTLEEYGIISYLLTFIALISTSFSGIQISSALGRFYTDKQFSNEKKLIFSSCFFALFLFSFTTFTLSGAVIFPLKSALFPKISSSLVLILLLVFSFLSTQEKFLSLFFKWDLNPKLYIVFYNFSPLFSLVLVLVFSAFMKDAARSFMSGITLASLITAIVLLLLLRKNFVFVIDNNWIKKVSLFALPLIPYTSTLLVLTFADRFLIRYFIGYESVAIYSLGAKISAVISAVSSGFRNAWGPYFYSTYSEIDSGKNYARVFDLFNFFAVGTMLFVVFFSDQIISMLSTEQYYPAKTIVPFLIVSNIVFNLQYFLLGIYIKNKTIYLTYSTLIGIVLNLTLDIFLIPKFKLQGAAIATMVSFSVMFIINMVLSQRLYKIPYRIKFNLISFTPWVLLCLFWNSFFVNYLGSTIQIVLILSLYIFINNKTHVFSFREIADRIKKLPKK